MIRSSRAVRAPGSKRAAAVPRLDRRVAELVQHLGDEQADGRIVLDDQDGLALAAGSLLRRLPMRPPSTRRPGAAGRA